MCHAFLSVCYLCERREQEKKQAHHCGHLTLRVFICELTFHPKAFQVESASINEENHGLKKKTNKEFLTKNQQGS